MEKPLQRAGIQQEGSPGCWLAMEDHATRVTGSSAFSLQPSDCREEELREKLGSRGLVLVQQVPNPLMKHTGVCRMEEAKARAVLHHLNTTPQPQLKGGGSVMHNRHRVCRVTGSVGSQHCNVGGAHVDLDHHCQFTHRTQGHKASPFSLVILVIHSRYASLRLTSDGCFVREKLTEWQLDSLVHNELCCSDMFGVLTFKRISLIR